MLKRSNTGFTLIELVITMLIVSILASIALPSYTQYITKSRRVAAEACLANYANFMERFYASNMRYDKDSTGTTDVSLASAGLECATSVNTGQYYTYEFNGTPTTSTYSLQARPLSSQLKNDAKCGNLRISQTSEHTISGTAVVTDCWAH